MRCSDKNTIAAWLKALLGLVLENFYAKLGLYVKIPIRIKDVNFPYKNIT